MDPIADFLTIIRNAYLAGLKNASVPHSKTKEQIAQILKEGHYLSDYTVESATKHSKNLNLTLHYLPSGQPVLTKVKRISKPSVRYYAKKDKLPIVLSHKGLAIISTSQGIMAATKARQLNLGGEVICYVY